ncbi:SecDF P1 head subdomain-containing protein [Pontibacillus yanchengensis]|uniref:SecDF P1 head subdomain domain-containing protein n=1 Tax=Pontibacillus yanchengensis Y32 TaxID=1385514 RepID=A0A0A2TF91_9BACI|nr:hypothetical protein [Pontibacillus yanchengensis]KGP74507.1 hypothetical protein N782_12290 [Pontibacillus yanchengensis Y32]
MRKIWLMIAGLMLTIFISGCGTSGSTLHFTAAENVDNEEAKEAVSSILSLLEMEGSVSSSEGEVTATLNEDISSSQKETLQKKLEEGIDLSFRDFNDKKMLGEKDLVAGTAEVSTRKDLDTASIAVQMKDKEHFHEITKDIANRENGKKQLVIWINYEDNQSFKEEKDKENPAYVSAPRVSTPLNTESVQIAGSFSEEEAKELVQKINIATWLHFVELESIDTK